MNGCNIAIYDLNSTRNMFLAAACIIVGVLFKTFYPMKTETRQVFLIFGTALYVFGWLFVGYNFQQSMPENAMIFWPAIVGIVASSIVYSITPDTNIQYVCLALYGISWMILGYFASNHLPGLNKWIGLLAAGFAILSSPFMSTPFGISGFTTAMGIMTILYGLPTLSSIKEDLPSCVAALIGQIPALQPYSTEITCLIKSGCWYKLSTLPSLSTRDAKLKLLAEIFQCMTDNCGTPTLEDYSNKFDCYASQGCFDDIIDNPASDFITLMQQAFKAYQCTTSTKVVNNCLSYVKHGNYGPINPPK
jgi:hypothetical protein